MDEDIRVLGIRVEWVPVSERGPIAAFQLLAADEAGYQANPGKPILPVLDRCDLAALISEIEMPTGEKIDRLDGLAYLCLGGREEGILALRWTRGSVTPSAVAALNSAIDDWMEAHRVTKVHGAVRKCPPGFRKTGFQIVERLREEDPTWH